MTLMTLVPVKAPGPEQNSRSVEAPTTLKQLICPLALSWFFQELDDQRRIEGFALLRTRARGQIFQATQPTRLKLPAMLKPRLGDWHTQQTQSGSVLVEVLCTTVPRRLP